MKTFKITKLTKAEEALKGMSVPEQKNGNVGSLVEGIMTDQGYYPQWRLGTFLFCFD